MNGDIRPTTPRSQPTPPGQLPPVLLPAGTETQPGQLPPVAPETPRPEQLPIGPTGDEAPIRPRRRGRLVVLILSILIGAALLASAAAGLWYRQSLQPRDASSKEHVRVLIEQGSRVTTIARLLEDKHIIRSAFAFELYTRLSSSRDQLQAGSYSLSPSESVKDIVAHLSSGKADTITLTFYPGATLRDDTATPEAKKTDVTTVLRRAGYSDAEINSALRASYDHPLFAGKPAGTSLEGYVYGETYTFSSDATVKEILTHTFDVFYQKIQAAGIIPALEQRGMTLYQGITLASIVQREVSGSDANVASNDQRQVAQVFYTRLAQNMPLGSDVTAYYGADQIGAARSVDVDTAYNTRKHTGLTPGPIATPGLGALQAVAQPAAGDYLFFLSGDDDVTYFAHTDAEHQRNIAAHCHVKCQVQ